MTFNYKKPLRFNDFGINIEGEIEIAGKSVPLILIKKKDSPQGNFMIKMDSIKVSDFSHLFLKKSIDDESKGSANTAMFSEAVLKQTVITGSRDIEGGYELVLNGEATGIKGFGPITLLVIIQKLNNQPIAFAIISEIKNIQPTKIISMLTGRDLSMIPIIKDITVDVVIEFSTNDILAIKDDVINKILVKYIANAKTVSKGTKIKLDVPIKEILEKIQTPASLKHIPDDLYIQIFIHEGNVCFRFPDNLKMNLLNILMALVPKIPDIIFKKVLLTPPNIVVEIFDVDIKTGAVNILLKAPEQIVLGTNLITIKDAEFELKREPKGSWDFKLKGIKEIAGGTLDILVWKKNKNYVFKGR